MNWKLWIATPLTLGLGLWFAHAVIPHTHPVQTPTCPDHTERADRDTDDGRPDHASATTLVSRLERTCEPDTE